MEIIFNKAYILDNIWLFWSYIIVIALIIIITTIYVKKETRSQK